MVTKPILVFDRPVRLLVGCLAWRVADSWTPPRMSVSPLSIPPCVTLRWRNYTDDTRRTSIVQTPQGSLVQVPTQWLTTEFTDERN